MYEVAKHFYFEMIPAAREFDDPDVNAFIDRLLTEDDMHRWLSQETAVLKGDIRSGKMQQIYEQLFTGE
jgi:hypothetical protein